MPVSSSCARITPSKSPTVGKFWIPEKPRSQRVIKNGSTTRNGSVPLTPASTGVRVTTGSTSRAISSTISLALP